jgi:predicted  nucleic acid-binding Zn-ribbon protein
VTVLERQAKEAEWGLAVVREKHKEIKERACEIAARREALQQLKLQRKGIKRRMYSAGAADESDLKAKKLRKDITAMEWEIRVLDAKSNVLQGIFPLVRALAPESVWVRGSNAIAERLRELEGKCSGAEEQTATAKAELKRLRSEMARAEAAKAADEEKLCALKKRLSPAQVPLPLSLSVCGCVTRRIERQHSGVLQNRKN